MVLDWVLVRLYAVFLHRQAIAGSVGEVLPRLGLTALCFVREILLRVLGNIEDGEGSG